MRVIAVLTLALTAAVALAAGGVVATLGMEHGDATSVMRGTAPRISAESSEVFALTDSEHRQVRPDVAGHPELGDCQNLVVWWDDTADEVWGKFVEREWRGEAFRISGEYSAIGPAKVAYNHHLRRWLVVWQTRLDDGRSGVVGRYVECGGLEGNVFGVSDDGTEDQPAVAPTGEQFAVVWRSAPSEERHQVSGALVAGFEIRYLVELTDEAAVSEPAIACENRGDCLVLWTIEREHGSDVLGRYWFPREDYVGHEALQVAVTERSERYPAVAWNGWYNTAGHAAYAVTWTDEGGEHSTVRARTVYPTDNQKLDTYVVSEKQILVSDEEWVSDYGDVASLGQDFVAVWSTGHDEPRHVVARRLLYDADTRTISRGDEVWVSDKEQPETYPAVASALDPLALVVWQIEWPAGAVDILGRYVKVGEANPGAEATDTPGHDEPTKTPERDKPTATPDTEGPETGDPFFVIVGEGRQVRPDVAGRPEVEDCQNLVVWLDETAGGIWGRFVEPNWRGEAFRIGDYTTLSDPALGRPKVAYNAHRKLWLVVFAYETDAGGSRIAGRYVQCGSLEGHVFVIGDEIGHDGDQPVVAPHGESFAVAWRRELDAGGHQIVGVQVNGLTSGQYAEISPDGDVSEPAIDCEVRGECLVTWTADRERGKDVLGRYWFPREEYVGDKLLEIAVDEVPEFESAVAWNNRYAEDGLGAYAVTWTAVTQPQGQHVMVRLVYPGGGDRLDGYVVGSDAGLVSRVESAIAGHSDVAALGPDYVVVNAFGDERLEDIGAQRLVYVPAKRELWLGEGADVGTHDAVEVHPAVASALDPLALVAWQVERGSARADILGRHVALHAAPGPRIVLVGSIIGQADGQVASTWPDGGATRGRSALDGGAATDSLAQAAPLLLSISSVLEGDFPCAQATLYLLDEDKVDPDPRQGDIVEVAAAGRIGVDICELQVGLDGTYVRQATIDRLVAPMALRQ